MCADNSIHFRHTNGCSCKSVKVFETANVSTWGGLEPPTFGFMPNTLTYWAIRARHLLSHVFLTLALGDINTCFQTKQPCFWYEIWTIDCFPCGFFLSYARTIPVAVSCTLQWRHNENDGVSNHRRLDCLLNRLLRSLAFVRGIHRWSVNSLHKGPVTRKMFPFDDVITTHWGLAMVIGASE